ncbi:MAG: MFS transporter [Vicinamibacteria bacterium]|nr:MFS transporter [Vicinamibacteria bacterium]
MNLAAQVSTIRSGFTRTFWVANTLELFERFAYYGSKAILAVYVAEQVGLGPKAAGWLVGSLFNTLLYLLPILAGTIVDRYGFKRSLLACFGIFSVGYFLIGLAGLPMGQPLVAVMGPRIYMILALTVTAIGGSLIKPSIVGTVARTTTNETKSLGYSIYYTLVNVGGAIGPMLAMLVRQSAGISYVLVMSSVTSLALVVGALVLYHEPPRPANAPPPGSFRIVLSRMLRLLFCPLILLWHAALLRIAVIIGDERRWAHRRDMLRRQLAPLRFLTFLVVFSGFWAMFWQIFYSLPFYVRDVLHFERFEIIETVDAWTIIVVTLPATAFAKKLAPIRAMSLGFALASVSWFVMGAVPTMTATVAAIALFAVGEAIQAPRYYEYVANIAPQEQVGTYMGFAFMPIAIGTFFAGGIAGRLVAYYVQGPGAGAPQRMWLIVGSIGVVSTALMLVYDRWVARQCAAP